MSFAIFHESIHFFVGAFLAIIFYRKFRSRKLVLIIFAVTFLIDLDHLFDYFYFAKNLKFWEFFGRVDFFNISRKNFVLAHSWELVTILGVLGWRKKMPVILAISFAMGGHLLVDQLSYGPHPLGYFLIFRALHNFSLDWFNGLQ